MIRESAVAGAFYPDDPKELQKMIEDFLATAKPPAISGRLRALIVPHAGYVYSGTATDYTVFVKLENVNDSDAVAAKDRPNSPVGTLGAGSKTFTISSGSCSGAANTFNYWVNNP